MRPFRFRAQTILDLRRGEEDAARSALARQRAECARLQVLADDAAQAVQAAVAAQAATATAGAAAALLAWHRSWIGKLRGDLAARRAVVFEAEQVAVRLAVALGQAVQKKRVLERLRERAWRRYRVDSDREHLRDMDRLAGMRHFAQAVEPGGAHHGDQSDGLERGDGVPDVESVARRGVL